MGTPALSFRNASLISTPDATIPGGRNYDIAKGSTVANPVCNFYVGANLALSVLLDPTFPLEATGDGEARLQRPSQTSWVAYQQNAVYTGDLDTFQILDRDEATVYSGTVGINGSGADYEAAGASTAVVSGQPVQTTGLVLTQPAS